MKMENLNKTQIVLLTLLTSFVTSIATGVVTVTLMDQAPVGVTQTINRVVERTIETITPGKNQVTTVVKEVVIKEKDLIANAVEKSLKSLVKIKAVDSEGVKIFLGLGTIISRDGYIATDKSRIEGNRNNLFVVYNKKSFPADVVLDEDSKVAILKIRKQEITQETLGNSDDVKKTKVNKIPELIPVSLADSEKIRLGQTVVSFTGETGDVVLTGIVSNLKEKTVDVVVDDKTQKKEKLDYILTNININKKSAGGPLFNTDGNVLGINVMSQDETVVTVPINNVKEALFNIASTTKETIKKDTQTTQ